MLGKNAIYLAKEIRDLNLYKHDRDTQMSILKDNKVLINAFYYALHDMGTMIYHFMGNDHGLNLYGFQGKFDSIVFITGGWKLFANGDTTWYDDSRKDLNTIVEDLETMAKLLEHDMNYNMSVIDSSNNKDYHKIQVELIC
jgi:hypothetical protein